MNKKYLAGVTLVLLAGLYLGCTDPNTVLDPRTPAGNATGTTSDGSSTNTAPSKLNATGYWLLEGVSPNTNKSGHVSLKQLADGKLIGEAQITYGNDIYLVNGTNTNGQLTLNLTNAPGTPLPGTFSGTISDDGITVVLTYSSSQENYQTKATRLF